ncbi:copper resistance CopC/CopD family protein [Listeria swaminathanii]|uniref:Copper resistance CopC/CopD family protein n=1 Tax=Listeria swaminathanii TaxID=2713501 RepID=A0ABU2IFE6_9LIST|nr:copper resistance CopC/CopD family protein [Listeria swaminathanii]MDT0017559.1 copper resistance CopC/CopD family protein [Listeria swaminathanii]MDT0022648.1 copper resistance CopC/CopD family protein [Listeria swaminathanii]MDT0033612.1 copper resistance CopC/CopD family protein [Listeria swaminathanii]MDT0052436.1 copper resistance CopC/CopD family protein [Listeria swaminathanii]MDT0055201.1 copper resistance CopC/CopD family protein [Listeria swaminathanii]
MKLLKRVSFIVILLYILIVPVQHVSAHAYLENSNPADQSHIKTAPEKVTLVFNEEIEADFPLIEVKDSSGKRVETGKTAVSKKNNHMVEASLPADLKDDVYSVSWRVVSADGHAVTGVISFKLGDTKATFQANEVPSSGGDVQISSVQKAILYIGFSLFIGMLLFGLGLYPRQEPLTEKIAGRLKKIAWLALVFLGMALLIQLFVQTSITTGVSIWESFQPSQLTAFLATKTGYMWISEFVVWFVLAIFTVIMFRKNKQSSWFALLTETALIGYLIFAKAQNGHAAASADKIVSITADMLHMIAASVWVGGILVLLFVLPRTGKAREIWSRFAIVAIIAVASILVSGLLMAVMNIGQMANLFTTNYGKMLLFKIGLFLLMALLGLGHYIYLKTQNKKIPFKTILVELIIGTIILVVASVLTNVQTPPPPAPKAFDETIAADGEPAKINLRVEPATVGQNQFIITFTSADGAAKTDFEQVTVTTKSTKTDEKSTFQAKLANDTQYFAEGLYINQTGKWEITVHGLTKDFTDINQTFTTNITQ